MSCLTYVVPGADGQRVLPEGLTTTLLLIIRRDAVSLGSISKKRK